MDDIFEQTDPASMFTATDPTTEVTLDNLNDQALRRVIDKVDDWLPIAFLMGLFQKAMTRKDIDTDVLHRNPTTFSVQGAN